MTDPDDLMGWLRLQLDEDERMARTRQALLVEPGRETRGVGQVETDAAREVQWYRAMHERAYKDWALRHGLGALGPSPAGARVSVVDAQVQRLDHTGGRRTGVGGVPDSDGPSEGGLSHD